MTLHDQMRLERENLKPPLTGDPETDMAACNRSEERRILRESLVLSMVGGLIGEIVDLKNSSLEAKDIPTAVGKCVCNLADAIIDELEKRK